MFMAVPSPAHSSNITHPCPQIQMRICTYGQTPFPKHHARNEKIIQLLIELNDYN